MCEDKDAGLLAMLDAMGDDRALEALRAIAAPRVQQRAAELVRIRFARGSRAARRYPAHEPRDREQRRGDDGSIPPIDAPPAMNPLHDLLFGPQALSIIGLQSVEALATCPAALNGAGAAFASDLQARGVTFDVGGQVDPTLSRSDVAVINVDGVLVKGHNWFTRLIGATAYSDLTESIDAAAADPSVRGIVLNVSSPGGSPFGPQVVAMHLQAARRVKQVGVFGAGEMASAAYWLAAGADLVACSPVAMVGSIGVVASHRDLTGMEAKAGVRTTEITAGRYKRIASQYAPLSEEGRLSLQEQVDEVYAVFVDDVAQARGVSPQTALDRMADGRIFVGKQAVAAGLVDAVSTLREVVDAIARQAKGA